MIRTSAKLVVKHKDDRLEKFLESAKNAYVTIGVHEGAGQYQDGTSVVEVALFNEFGTRNIPERSFLRSTFDESASKINQFRDEAIKNVIEHGWSVEKALESIGFKVMTLVQNKIKSNVPPPLAQSTADQKRRDGVPPVTLVDTGLLLRSITYEVHA